MHNKSPLNNLLSCDVVIMLCSDLSWLYDSFPVQHPEFQALAQEEVDRVLGDSDVVTSEMEKELRYVANCIKESQRLIPVITGFSRGAVEDTELGGKVYLYQR